MPTVITNNKYCDKLAEMQVMACLIKDPLLFNDNKYRLDVTDFSDQFHRIVFGAIDHLAAEGAESISYIDIDQFLKNYPTQYKVFIDNKGPDFIANMEDIIDERNFNSYYQRMRKMSILNVLEAQGYDVSPIYNPSILDPAEFSRMQHKFDSMKIEDITSYFESNLVQIKEKFVMSNDLEEGRAGDLAEDLIDRYKTSPDMGLAFTSPKLTTIYSGMILGKLHMESSASGVGKSRRQAELTARVAVGTWYDLKENKWLTTGHKFPALQISTELDHEEVETMWLATIAGVPEDHILHGKYYGDEESRVRQAAKLMKDSNLYFVGISDFDVEDILNIILKYHINYDVNYIFLDYLSESIKILAESASKTKVQGLRTDQVLLMYVTKLKDFCKKHKVYIWTATQLSGDWKNAKEADEQLLRGAKSLKDKVDCAAVLLPVRESDKPIIAVNTAKGFELMPTHVIHIFKVRRGSFNNIRLYIVFDKALCRSIDCFVTDAEGKIIDMDNTDVELLLEQTTDNSKPEYEELYDNTLEDKETLAELEKSIKEKNNILDDKNIKNNNIIKQEKTVTKTPVVNNNTSFGVDF